MQLGVAVLGQHGGQCLDDGVQIFQRVVALGQKQHRRGGKLPRVPERAGVKQWAQCFVAGVVAGARGQGGAGGTVETCAAGHMAGIVQQSRFFCRQCVKICLHIVQQLPGHGAVNGVPHRARMAVGVGHAVAQVGGAVPHDTLDAEQHRQVLRPGGVGHHGGGIVLGAPDVHKVKRPGLQKRRKGGGIGHDAVVHAVRRAAGIGLADAEHRQMQIGVGAQCGQLAGQPAAAHVAGPCQSARHRRLRQRRFYKPENVHGVLLL